MEILRHSKDIYGTQH